MFDLSPYVNQSMTVPCRIIECPKKVNRFLTNIFSVIDAPNILKTIVFLGKRNGKFRYCDYIMGLLEFQKLWFSWKSRHFLTLIEPRLIVKSTRSYRMSISQIAGDLILETIMCFSKMGLLHTHRPIWRRPQQKDGLHKVPTVYQWITP